MNYGSEIYLEMTSWGSHIKNSFPGDPSLGRKKIENDGGLEPFWKTVKPTPRKTENRRRRPSYSSILDLIEEDNQNRDRSVEEQVRENPVNESLETYITLEHVGALGQPSQCGTRAISERKTQQETHSTAKLGE